MGDNWDDGSDDDDWDVSDDDLDARLGLNKKKEEEVPQFDDEVDLTVVEKEKSNKLNNAELKKKGNARSKKKAEELKAKEELEYAKLAMQIELENEEKMTPEEYREHKKKQQEENDNRAVDDLFGGPTIGDKKANTNFDRNADVDGKLKFENVIDHMLHAKKIGAAVKEHGKIHWTKAFLEETIKQCKDVLDADAVAGIIKVCNVIKNEKVQASKRKVKGEASKIKKRDKAAERKAKQIQKELFGDNDHYDEYDEMGGDFEDNFF